MFEPQEIRSEHKDVIHDVAYDYYGQRIATCSSDQTVKVNALFQIIVILADFVGRHVKIIALFRLDLGSK